MIEELRVWAIQDALLAAFGEQEAMDAGGAHEVALDLGFPAEIQTEHVWIEGGAEGSLTFELTADMPSDESCRMKVFVFVQMAGEYVDVRARIKTLAAAVVAALGSGGVAAVAPSWSVPGYKLDAGTDGSNRQLCLELSVEFTCW